MFDYNDDDIDKRGTATASDDGKTLHIGGTWKTPEHNGSPAGYYISATTWGSGYTLNVNGATFDNA